MTKTLTKPTQLRCEYLQNPLGIDVAKPRLSWLVGAVDEARGIRQSAYQIAVASTLDKLESDEYDVWDTGQVTSDQSNQVTYAGPALLSGSRYWWKVRTWCEREQQASPWSDPTWWEMGLLDPAKWLSQWIGSSGEMSEGSNPCPYLRTAFTINKPVERARVYVSALGLYELWLNGQRVGEDLFTPGWTDYDKRIQYQTYDVTAQVREGENAIGAILGDGWYCGYLAWAGKKNTYGDRPKLLAQLELQYVDGSRDVVSTDASWLWRNGPLRASDIYNGERYDARLAMVGWCEPGFNTDDWLSVRTFAATCADLVASASPRVRRTQEIMPVSITETAPGVFVFDLGQNMVGWARLRVNGEQGDTVTLRFAEALNADGTIYTANLRSARCTDIYTLRGEGEEAYEPRFTFHGFRYVEMTGYPGRPEKDAITGVVLHSDTPPTGSFECSDPMLNQLQSNITWGQRGNFLEVPTDCPQRDERLGWTGDAQVFIRTACFNMDVAGFFTKWLTDLSDAQAPSGAYPSVAPDVLHGKRADGGAAWADAGIICPWTIYLCYEDARLLQRLYSGMARYMTYLADVDQTSRHCYSDWLNINDPTPNELIGVAFHAYGLQLMMAIAEVLGEEDDVEKYGHQLQKVKREFNDEFVTPNGRLVSSSQTGYVLALQFGLLPESLRGQAVKRLVQRIHERKDHLSTGFVGTPYLLAVLSENGHLDLAYKLLLNKDFPSWGYPITQGATTMWERWDTFRHDKGFQSPSMNSFNHYAYGAVGDWMYRTIAGLDTDPAQPGYRRLIIRPRPGGGLTWAKASLKTMYGQARVSWRISQGSFDLHVTVPPNAEAVIVLPAADSHQVLESGKQLREAEGITEFKVDQGRVTCNVGSGVYQFTVPDVTFV